VPLVFESQSWQHGVLVAATMGSEKTAAAAGGLGELRRDPFAMLPFCGYNMADYFTHWLSMAQRTDEASLPAIYGVNWFRKGPDGKFLWPGFGENSRVLEWIFRRCDGESEAAETPIGLVPAPGQLNVEGLDVSEVQMQDLLAVDGKLVKEELPAQHQHFARFGDHLPEELHDELRALEARLGVQH
jgi:phosphoenolpyruvate carboxykinase (GTP)